MSECDNTVSVAKWLSIGLSRGGLGYDITAGPPLDVFKVTNWEVSAAFVPTRANG